MSTYFFTAHVPCNRECNTAVDIADDGIGQGKCNPELGNGLGVDAKQVGNGPGNSLERSAVFYRLRNSSQRPQWIAAVVDTVEVIPLGAVGVLHLGRKPKRM